MLVRSISAKLPGVGRIYAMHDAVHPRFRARSIEHWGVVNDDLIVYPSVPWSGRGDGRAVVSVVLSGLQRIVVRGEGERWLEPGGFAVCRDFASLYRRDEGDHAHSLSFEWEPDFLGVRPPNALASGVLRAADLAALRLICRSFVGAGYDVERAATHLEEALRLLREAGIPFVPVKKGDIVDASAAPFAPLSRVMDASLSVSGSYPMSVDLEVAAERSRWQVTRRIAEMNARFGLSGENWRETRAHWRLMLAVMLMTHGGAASTSVATALGYGAAQALYRAFARAGLPAPGRMREAAKALL